MMRVLCFGEKIGSESKRACPGGRCVRSAGKRKRITLRGRLELSVYWHGGKNEIYVSSNPGATHK
jgi:hypothetical protein